MEGRGDNDGSRVQEQARLREVGGPGPGGGLAFVGRGDALAPRGWTCFYSEDSCERHHLPLREGPAPVIATCHQEGAPACL